MNQQLSSPVSPRKNLKSTFVLFISIVLSIFIFMLVALFIGQNRGALMPSLNQYHSIISFVMAFVSIGCLYLAKKIFSKEVVAAKDSLKPLNEKLNNHRFALIKYLVICEIPVMLSIVLYLLTANFIFLVYAGIFLGFMLTLMPTRAKVTELLELDSEAQEELSRN